MLIAPSQHKFNVLFMIKTVHHVVFAVALMCHFIIEEEHIYYSSVYLYRLQSYTGTTVFISTMYKSDGAQHDTKLSSNSCSKNFKL